MTVKELVELLKNYEDFEIRISFLDEKHQGKGMPYWRFFKIDKECGICDVGHSDKVVTISIEER